jgi:signal transduction histidine kinase
VATKESFPRLVSLACHDLRTPLATVHGFARTLERLEPLGEKSLRYVGLIAEASAEMAEMLDRLAVVARIERGAYEPNLQEVDSLELVRAAVAQAELGQIDVGGKSANVTVDREWIERSVADFAKCALRHGDADRITITVAGSELRLSPISEGAGRVLVGEELRDLGAETARRLFEALGGSVALEGDAFVLLLPAGERAT